MGNRAGGKWAKTKAFLRQEGGSATIEFVLWLPIVIAILLLSICRLSRRWLPCAPCWGCWER